MNTKKFNSILLNFALLSIDCIILLISYLISVDPDSLICLIVMWNLVLLLPILINSKSSLSMIAFVSLFMTWYSTSAFIASFLGFTYFDIPQQIIFEVTQKSLLTLIVCHFVLILCKILFKFPSLDWIETNFIGVIQGLSKNRIKFMIVILMTLGVYFWYRIIFVIGITSLLENPRIYAAVLFEQVGFYHQIIMVPITFILIVYMINTKGAHKLKAWIFISGILIWLPMVLVGARKELYICVIVIFLFGGITRIKKVILGIVVTFMFLIIPLFREGWVGFDNIILSFQEFILPQYSHFIFEILGDIQKNAIVDISGYQAGFWSLFPGFLRPHEYVPLGLSLFNLRLTNVGIAAHPIGEAVLNFGELGYVLFGFIFVGVTVVAFISSKKSIIVSVILFAYLSLLGRSDLWITIFFCLYTCIVTSLFFIRLHKK
ncbi:hypothetical protein [Bacillus cereus]|uniref:hypothetical protein n=1 Tax=Bacillus cereus TaxID=1396 RepID=UPI001146070E|nr:hypothetical protein [Bacillus cereus]